MRSTNFRGQRFGLELVSPVQIVGLIEGQHGSRVSQLLKYRDFTNYRPGGFLVQTPDFVKCAYAHGRVAIW